MRKIFKTVAALAVVMFAGCTNDLTNEVVAPMGETTVVGVGIADTKTYLGELVDGARKVYWSENDQITINGNASTDVVISDDACYAEFSFTGVLEHPYSVLYPASDYVDASTINLPAIQEAAEGTFATNCAPMACVATEGDAIALHHLAAVVRLQVKLPAEDAHNAHKIAKVEFRGKAGEQVSGKFAINYAEAALTATSTAEADKVVTTKVDKALSTEATDIFVVVPAGEYAEGFTVRVIDEAGHYMDIATSAITLAKGDIKAMPAFNFVPTNTQVGVEIKSAAEFVQFAKDYNAKKYENVEDLKVYLTEDIVFDDETSAAWVPIGGKFEDGTSLYWKGDFDGNDHKIKNWVTSKPLFGYSYQGTVIKNVIIDSSCTLTATAEGAVEDIYFSPIIAYAKGEVENCVNNANITVTGEWPSGIYIAGIASRAVEGDIINCTNNGAITFDASVTIPGKDLYVGGLIGRISNGAGKAINSKNNGAITLTGSNESSKNHRIGGIAGYAAGEISGCVNNGAISGDITANYHYVGGVVGDVAKATATANILNNINNGAVSYTPAAAANRLVVGGIIGLAENLAASIEGNTNTASVDTAGTATYAYIGGGLGWLPGAVTGSFKNNSVTNTVVVNCTGQGTNTGVGGLVGASNGGAVIDLKDDNGVIACTVKGGSSAGSSNHVGIGGIVGFLNGTITIKNVTNWTGQLQIDLSAKNNTSCAAFGAILGYTSNGVVIEGCTPAGTFKWQNLVALQGKVSVGGMVGLCKGLCSISNCTNNQTLNWAASSKQANGNACYTGGIVGWCDANNDLTITNCHNTEFVTGRAYNNNNNTGTPNYIGGIIGVFGRGTTAGTLTITNCSSTGKVYTTRGTGGGLAGYVRNATITGCTFKNEASICGFFGGIVAEAIDTEIKDCTVVGNLAGATGGSCYNNAGGIAGWLGGTSSIDNCAYYGTITLATGKSWTAYYGGIAGYVSSESTVKNCKFGGSVNGVAITADNCVANVANLNDSAGTPDVTTPTLTDNTYWDGK